MEDPPKKFFAFTGPRCASAHFFIICQCGEDDAGEVMELRAPITRHERATH